MELFGEVSDSIGIKDFDLEDVENDRLTVILEKPTDDGWCYFLTLKGFENWLRTNQFSAQNAANSRSFASNKSRTSVSRLNL